MSVPTTEAAAARAAIASEIGRRLAVPGERLPFPAFDLEDNDWDGLDVVSAETGDAVLRWCPVDGGPSVGWDLFAFTGSGVVTRQATLRGEFSATEVVLAGILVHGGGD